MAKTTKTATAPPATPAKTTTTTKAKTEAPKKVSTKKAAAPEPAAPVVEAAPEPAAAPEEDNTINEASMAYLSKLQQLGAIYEEFNYLNNGFFDHIWVIFYLQITYMN